jgi:predicted RNase H-like HicB family nuclease
MKWSVEERLRLLMLVPWTIEPGKDDATGELTLRVRELPSVVATGDTKEALAADFWESLEATLRTYLHYSDPLPRPPRVSLWPWEQAAATVVPGATAVSVSPDNPSGEVRPLQPTGGAQGGATAGQVATVVRSPAGDVEFAVA